MTGPDRTVPAPLDVAPARSVHHAAGGGSGEPYAAVTQTHSAVVFLVGDRAYKLKKPVAFNDRWRNYRPAAAADSWQRVLAFFAEHVMATRPGDGA